MPTHAHAYFQGRALASEDWERISSTEQRSSQWYAGTERNAYIHRAWMRRGLPAHAFDGRPHIAIANSVRPDAVQAPT